MFVYEMTQMMVARVAIGLLISSAISRCPETLER